MPKWEPCGHKGPLSNRGVCQACRKKRRLKGNAKGGEATGELKVAAGHKGGQWSGMMRRIRNFQNTGAISRNCDLTLEKMIALMDAQDMGTEPDNIILEHARLERTDRIKDRCVKILANAARNLRRSSAMPQQKSQKQGFHCTAFKPWQKCLLRLVLATVFTQGSKEAAPLLLPHVENKVSFTNVFCENVTCGSQTFRGVMCRQTLMKKAFWNVEQYIVRKFSSMKMHANLAAFIEDLVRILLPCAGRRLFFHCSEIAFFMIILPFRLQNLLRDRGREVPVRIGSIEGLRVHKAMTGLDAMPTVESVAHELGITQRKAQTSLCIYGKYNRYYHQGIGRWYHVQPKCIKQWIKQKNMHS